MDKCVIAHKVVPHHVVCAFARASAIALARAFARAIAPVFALALARALQYIYIYVARALAIAPLRKTMTSSTCTWCLSAGTVQVARSLPICAQAHIW